MVSAGSDFAIFSPVFIHNQSWRPIQYFFRVSFYKDWYISLTILCVFTPKIVAFNVCTTEFSGMVNMDLIWQKG